MFDLAKAESLKDLPMTQVLVSTAISLVLVIAPLSPSFATELQQEPEIELTKKGSLRVLYQGLNDQHSSITQKEQDLVEQFALENKLATEWIAVEEDWQLMPSLIEGRGDIIIGQGESLASGLSDQISFTYSWGTTTQQVVVRTDTTQISRLEDLLVRQIALKKSSPAWSILEKHLAENPAMDLVEIPEVATLEEIMLRVASGEYDVTIVESDYLQTYLPKHPEVNVAFDFSKAESRAWAVRTNAETLQNRLGEYLNKNHLSMILADVRLVCAAVGRCVDVARAAAVAAERARGLHGLVRRVSRSGGQDQFR